MELIASMLTIDDLNSLSQVNQHWALLYDKTWIARLVQERAKDGEGSYIVDPRKLLPGNRSILGAAEPCGCLLSIGKVYSRESRYWYTPSRTRNVFPAFL